MAVTSRSGAHFVYGTLRPGELAYRQVAKFVESEPASLDGWQLAVRDGLPLIRRRDDGRVEGDLLVPVPEAEADLAKAIADYEGTKLYKSQAVTVTTSAGPRSATTYVGVRPNVGNPVDLDVPWRSGEDPLLSTALDVVANLARKHFEHVRPCPADMHGFWESFVPLQGLYLTLCSILERYTALVFGPTIEPAQRVAKLRDDDDAQRAVDETDPPAIRIVDSRDPEDSSKAPGRKAFDAWYQARSNLSHRGKEGYTDFEHIERSLVGLHDALRRLLELQAAPPRPTSSDGMLGPVYRRFRPSTRQG